MESLETETTDPSAWATVLYDKLCLPGVLVLDFSLRKQGSKYPLIVIMTNEAARDADITSVLDAAGITMVFVDTIFAEYQGRRYFGNWQKLSAWSLTDYERIVLLDSNHLILHPIDDLQTLLFSHGLHHSGGDRNDYIAAVLTAPGHPHPSTIILHPSLAQYQRLRSTLNEFFFSRANEQDVLVMAYRGRVASLLGGYSALESKWGGMCDDGARVKVRLYDLGRPWEKREGRGAVREWLDVWREVRGEWVGDGMLSGVGLGDGRRRLWERVLGPMVGGGL